MPFSINLNVKTPDINNEAATIRALVEKGARPKEIAEQLGISSHKVWYRMKKYGIPAVSRRRETPFSYDDLYDFLKAGGNHHDFCSENNITANQLHHFLARDQGSRSTIVFLEKYRR